VHPYPPPPAIREKLVITSDSVGTTVRMLSQLVLLVDRQGRRSNALSDSLAQVRAQLTPAPRENALLGNADDVVTTGHRGRNVPCEVRSERGIQHDELSCDAVVGYCRPTRPRCSGGSRSKKPGPSFPP
jgi:hypothetical protein